MFGSTVFGIGLGRTGSVSLSRALEHLGIKTVHYPGDTTKQELLTGQCQLSMFKNYQGLVDGIQPFYRHLDQCYPGSKFILTVREIEGLVRSRLRLKEFLKALRPKMSPLHREYHAYVEVSLFGAIDPDAPLIRAGIERHVADVTEYFRKRQEDLLVLDIPGGDGWSELCPFLSVKTPDVPFPRSNSSEDLAVMTQRLNMLWDELHRTIPPGTKFLFVDDAALGLHFAQHECLPFPNRDGVWWGLPANSKTAIREFDKALNHGVQYIAFAWPSFWWFDYYAEFFAYLHTNPIVIKKEYCVLFDCRSARS